MKHYPYKEADNDVKLKICFQKLRFSKGNLNSQEVIRSILNMNGYARQDS